MLLLYLQAVFAALCAVPCAESARFFSNNTVPANLTVSCSNALLTEVQCSPVVPQFQNGYFYPPSLLNRTCTVACSTALQSYEKSIATSCSGQSWAGYDDEADDMPLVVIPNLMRFNYDMICLQDSGRWCNAVSAATAVGADPGNSPFGWDDQPPTGVVSSGPCDLCFIKTLQKQAESPYYDGPALRRSSVYEWKTKSCGISNQPLMILTLPFSPPSTTEPTPTPSACAGKTYALAAGDDCYKVSKSQGIGTAWLLIDNNLAAYCSDFPKSGNLCLVNTCKTYQVKTNETCEGIASGADITVTQLKAWNPVINAGCYNLDRLNGTYLFTSSPGGTYVVPTNLPTLAPSTAVTPAPVPTDAADASNKRCGKWYDVQAGDYCNLVTVKFGISLDDFIFLNPSINTNCTDLLRDISYCVAPVGDINTYSGRPGFPTPGVTGIPFAKVTLTPTTPSATPKPTGTKKTPYADGTRDDCYLYFKGSTMQTNLTGTSYKNMCTFAADIYNVNLDDFGLWNQGIGNVTDPGCTFKPDVQYCGKLYMGEPPPPVDGPDTELPLRDGADTNCTQYGDVPDWFVCEDVLSYFNITIQQLYAWNPAVLADCTGLWPGYSYCVAGPAPPGTPTTTVSSSVSTTRPQPTAPTFSGQPANCVSWYTVADGDSCSSIADKFFITVDQFFAWNPAVSKDCKDNFWLNYAYCVGTADSITITRTPVSTAPITTTSAGLAVPSPTQDNNAVSNCNKYDKAVDGDYCSKFAERNKISLENLYAWNKILDNGNACDSSFWLSYYYCIGVFS